MKRKKILPRDLWYQEVVHVLLLKFGVFWEPLWGALGPAAAQRGPEEHSHTVPCDFPFSGTVFYSIHTKCFFAIVMFALKNYLHNWVTVFWECEQHKCAVGSKEFAMTLVIASGQNVTSFQKDKTIFLFSRGNFWNVEFADAFNLPTTSRVLAGWVFGFF